MASGAAIVNIGDVARSSADLVRLIDNVESVFRGKREVVELAVIALVAEGHLLLEDVPGVGKTTLAKALAHSIGCAFNRIQFTSDLLPSDVLGVSIFDKQASDFVLRKGPIFANIVLADEINRTTPRSQSALLEAMNERQVTIDNETHTLPRPFMVMATQNPLDFAGTYPLPESQMDRFIMRLEIGYPDRSVEREIVKACGYDDSSNALEPVLSAEEIVAIQDASKEVQLSESVLDYLQELVGRTRQSPYLSLGVSIRGAISLSRVAQAKALLDGRDYVLPDDVKDLFANVCAHRVMVKSFHDNAMDRRREAENILGEIWDKTPVPV
jgi:MoxR-like ATPase